MSSQPQGAPRVETVTGAGGTGSLRRHRSDQAPAEEPVRSGAAGYVLLMTVGDDGAGQDPVVMESAMDTGSDVGEPGDRPDEGPLTGDERALLARLTADERADVVTGAPEDSPEAARAVADDTVLPSEGSAGEADADTPRFRDAP
jgi:hypothetical protein